MMDNVEINAMDKRDDAFYHLEQMINNFKTDFQIVKRPPSELKIKRVLRQLEVWMDGCVEAHYALMGVMTDRVRKEKVRLWFTALKMILQDIHDLAEDD